MGYGSHPARAAGLDPGAGTEVRQDVRVTELIIPTRFCGPPSSANGGWTAGALAERRGSGAHTSWPAVEVTLRQPPPLEAPLRVATDEDALTLSADDTLVASARAADDADIRPVDPVPRDEAAAAAAAYPGLRAHPFPTCFVCGTERAVGDGLRIFPGPVPDADGDRVAAPWVPHPNHGAPEHHDGRDRVGVPVTWAALDCAGAWASDIENRPMVLGRMTAEIDALPIVGEEHVVIGQHLRTEGRKTFSATTVLDSDGRVVARAHQVWIAIDPAAFAAAMS